MTDEERYELVDLPFYKKAIEPMLPPTVLDFHAHVWTQDQWLPSPAGDGGTGVVSGGPQGSDGLSYMQISPEYSVNSLIADTRRMFPGKDYRTVLFGQPSLLADIDMTNAYIRRHGRASGFYPLVITGRNRMPVESLREQIADFGFFGYKVLLDWIGDDYAGVGVQDMIGPAEMELANELGLVVLLHVPGARRLADPRVQRDVRDYARRYPNAQIVLAHCGRCYLPGEMLKAIDCVRDLDNVYFDTAMVMEPSVLRVVLDNIDSKRLLFGTDLPVAAMRGRRVYAMDHWVDLVIEGYPSSAFRVPSSNVNATFMAYEIILAIRLAGEMAGLSPDRIKDIFCNNGMNLLRNVMCGAQMELTGGELTSGVGVAETTCAP